MTLDFTKPFLDMDEKPVISDGKPITLNKFLAQLLSQDIGGGSKDAFKIDAAMRIAKELHKGNSVDVTDSESELLTEVILNSQAVISLKHQLLAVVREVK